MILNFKVSESSQDEPKVKSSWKKTRNEERHAKWLAKSTTNSNSTPVAAAKVIPLENQIPKVSVEKKVSVIPAATSAVSATASEPKKIASVSPVKKQEIITDTTTKAISKPVIPILVSINKSSSIFTSNPEIPVIKETLKPKKITSETVFSKLETFQEMNLNPLIVKHLSAKLNIKKPTKIQRVAVPALLDNISNDFLIKAQTGSGKTLTFLLPVIHTILKAVDEMEDKSLMNRSIGSLAIIIAPTRELATQIFSIVESVLQYSNAGIKSIDRIDSNISEVDTAAAPTFKKHWIVPGLLIGGAKKSSDKARIRKGINILVATPGRLLDHLKTTVSFEAGNLRWIILDEADRLLELGFQDTLHEILQILDIKRGVAVRNQSRLKVECWPAKRQTVLCSATLSDGVTELAKSKLVDPVMINQDDLDKKVVRPVSLKDSVVKDFSEKVAEKVVEKAKINEDAQIKKQDAIIKESAKETEKSKSIELKSGDKLIKSVVTKEKIVEKKLATKSADDSSKKESNALIAKAKPIVESDREENSSDSSQDSDQEDETEYIDEKPRNNLDIPKQLSQKYMIAPAKQRLALLVSILRHKSLENKKKKTECKIMVFFDSCDSVDFYHYLLTNGSKETTGSLIPTKILKLHGNLDQKVRSSTMNEYKALETSIMFCTDVAGRGLDVANVSLIIQYDPPSNIQDYVHRVGRTARLGRHGESIIFILPSEVGFIDLLIGNGVSGLSRIEAASAFKYLVSSDDFTGLMKRDSRVEVVATDLHMMLERFVLSDETARKMAMSAFSSHVKAYATHSESEIFHLKKLHLGHVCKSFGLRDAPNHANSFGGKQIKKDLDAKDGKCGYSTFKRKSDYLIRDCKNEFSDGGVKRIIVDGDDRTVVKRQRMKKIY